MKQGDIFNVVFLCIVNLVFMVTGIFLNSVVIISLWRSRQLRKKLCYFMILVLSCVDLAVVTITHPLLISSTIYYFEGINVVREVVRATTSYILVAFSMSALFTLNVERFLALICPFFHQASVTKTRLVCFLAFVTIIIAGLPPLVYFNGEKTIPDIIIVVYFLLVLFLIIYGNYRIFAIAKSKRTNVRIAPTTAARSTNERRKKRILNLKNISTCSLAVGFLFVCSCPEIINAALRSASETPFYDQKVLLFSLWSHTFLSINSTFNCLIFFWRNSILRREGTKIINALRAHVIN